METRILEGEIVGNRLDDARLYEGVRTRRIFAFLIDYFFVGLLMIPFAVVVLVLGVVTLGLGWMLFGVLFPVVALTYIWTTMGGEKQATPGMSIMGIRLERLDGRRIDGAYAALHSILFWAANALLTPFVLIFTLIADRKRALHDILLGTVVVRKNS